MPSSDVPLITPGYSHRSLQLLLQFRQQLQRFDGPQFVQVQRADALGDAVSHRLEELDLHRPAVFRFGQFLGDHVLGALVQLQHLARALDHAQRQAGQARHLDAVAAVGACPAPPCAGR